jgi:hypothetical protein
MKRIDITNLYFGLVCNVYNRQSCLACFTVAVVNPVIKNAIFIVSFLTFIRL